MAEILGPAGSQAAPLGSGPIDAYGNVVSPTQQSYVSLIQWINGSPHLVYAVNPNYNGGSSGAGTGQSAAGAPPQYQFTFDTIGQTIYRSLGHCRLPLRIIWAQGVDASDVESSSATLTFAAALCAPIDPDETGEVALIFSGSTAIYDPTQGGVIVPDGTSDTDATRLKDSINAAVVYPGDEAQLPSPLIVADKGADKTNAFRGIRYIVFPNFPLALSGGLPTNLSIQWKRTNDLTTYAPKSVELEGSTTGISQ